MLLILLVCAAFVAGTVLVLPTRPVVAYSAFVFFGLGGAIALVNLLPGSSYLELEQRGFTFCSVYRKTFQRWEDITEFFPIFTDQRKPLVGWRLSPHVPGHTAMRRLTLEIAGAEGALPETYGLSAADLAVLLNNVRGEQVRTI
jgi:hypothetical protein